MTLKPAANAPITCTDWGDLADEDGFLALGRNRYHCSYVIYTDGARYYAENGTTGNLDYGGPHNRGGVSGVDPTAVIHAAWGNMPNGGRIYLKGTFNLGANGLTFNLTKNIKDLIIEGEGETGTVLQYTGTDYAITITTVDVAVGYYNVILNGFQVTGSVKTAGRNGIKIIYVGRMAVVKNLVITQFDIGLRIEETNTVTVMDTKVFVCNTGIYMKSSATDTTNVIALYRLKITDCTDYGIYWNHGAGGIINGGAIETCGTGIYVETNLALTVDTVYFGGNTVVDIDAHGVIGFSIESMKIVNCYFNSPGIAHAIKVYYAKALTIENARSRNHTTAFLWYMDAEQQIVIINPYITDPQLLDGAPTQTIARLAGMVIENRRQGLIVLNASGSAMVEGDVCIWSGGAGVVVDSAGANDNNPGVVMYGAADGDPVVVCNKGITPVSVGAATNVEDTLVASNVVPEALVNNAQTDPKKIIGYIVAGTVGAGTAYVRVL